MILPDSVVSIANYSFGISYNAFFGCSGFSGSLNLPKKVSFISDYAFYRCLGLVTKIGSRSFCGCSNIKGLYQLPNQLSSIGEGAFYNCNRINNFFTIPDSVVTISAKAF